MFILQVPFDAFWHNIAQQVLNRRRPDGTYYSTWCSIKLWCHWLLIARALRWQLYATIPHRLAALLTLLPQLANTYTPDYKMDKDGKLQDGPYLYVQIFFWCTFLGV